MKKILLIVLIILSISSCSSYLNPVAPTKSNYVNTNTDSSSPLAKFSTATLKISRQNLLNQGNYSAARVTEIELEKRGVVFENKSATGLETFSFNTLIQTRNNLKAQNLDTSLVEDEIAKRKETGITEEITTTPTSNSLANLTMVQLKEKQEKAIQNKEYVLADSIEKKIKEMESQPTIEELEKQQKEALVKKDFLLAEKIEKQKEALTKSKDSNSSLASITKTTTKTSVKEKPRKGSNNRETSLLNMVQFSTNITGNTSDNKIVTFTSSKEGSKAKVKSHTSNDESEIKYRRSSLYTMMIENTTREYSKAIKNTFGNQGISEKFNDHNIGPYLIHNNQILKDQSGNITNYLRQNYIAKKMVAKWFNRNEKGEFNMQLVAERGNYNATDLDVHIARNNERGEAILADAGEELIGNTFIIVNDYKYTNKEKVAKKAGGLLRGIANIASYIPGAENISNIANLTNVGVQVAGKGYVIKTTSYLYRLVWDKETAATFYNNYWVDENNYDADKVKAFENSNLFKLEYIGSQNAWADVQSSAFSHKSNEDLIRRSTIKATDKAIAKLQRKYDKFKTKSPLISGNPIAAKIGLKEGIEKGDKFEVLEQVLNKKGKTEYKRVGIVKVDKNHIWDNRFMANEENTSSFEYTTFKGSKGKFQAGMLIRQIN